MSSLSDMECGDLSPLLTAGLVTPPASNRARRHRPAVMLLRHSLLPIFLLLSLFTLHPSLFSAPAPAPSPRVTFAPPASPSAAAFPLHAATLNISSTESPAVHRAARDFQSDIERVTTRKPPLNKVSAPNPPPASDFHSSTAPAVVIGTLGQSPQIDALVRSGKLDVSKIQGRWESFLIATVDLPPSDIPHSAFRNPHSPQSPRTLVIVGSDPRGTIYGIYTLSAAIGVSPWYWWADVPVPRHDEIHINISPSAPHIDPGPVVKYRGIFLNDEAPALTNWTREKFGGFNHKFYAHVFELILRLRGNYLWPAMWGSAFNDDDPLNAQLATDHGIVMGASHHEPMARAHDEWRRHGKGGAWNYNTNAPALREFWRDGLTRTRDREQILSIGMRGDGDEPMSAEANTALLERIVSDQRDIIRDVTGRAPAAVPQLWALYKEVQEYYEKGMTVPDDVTLLWCDDNWGNIRRLPTPAERKRSGGAGVYYHFDYVGGPRNYKWLNTVTLPQIQEQMNLAWQHGADRIWIVNVGDLKPMEYPISYFLDLAWNPANPQVAGLSGTGFQPMFSSNTTAYSRAWTTQQFGPAHAAEIAALIDGYARLNNRRKPELLAPDTLSLVNYDEAVRVLAEWRDLNARADAVNTALPPEHRDAFFQLVLYPIRASATVQELHIAAGLNQLHARQGRPDANAHAARVRTLFAKDAAHAAEYHALRDGKWNHMMDQIRLGYTYWQQPDIAATPPLLEVRPAANQSLPALALEGAETSFPSYGARAPTLPPLDGFSQNTRWLELFNRGDTPFTYTITASQPWLTLTPSSGTIATKSTRTKIAADWSAVPPGETTARIIITPSSGAPFTITLPVYQPDAATRTAARGRFVETDRHLAIEAPHFSRAVPSDNAWQTLPNFGRTLGAVTPLFTQTTPAQEGAASRRPTERSSAKVAQAFLPVTPQGCRHTQTGMSVLPSSSGGTPPLPAHAFSDTSPRLEYDIYLRTLPPDGALAIELHCAPSLDFDPTAPLQIAISIDDAPPQILRLDTAATPKDWERSVADNIRRVISKHTLSAPGAHTLKLWRVTPGIVLERIIINTGGLRPSYLGPPESPLL